MKLLLVRYAGVIRLVFLVFHLLTIIYVYLLKCTSEAVTKHKKKADSKLDLPCFSIGCWKCMRVDSLNYNIGLLNGVDC